MPERKKTISFSLSQPVSPAPSIPVPTTLPARGSPIGAAGAAPPVTSTGRLGATGPAASPAPGDPFHWRQRGAKLFAAGDRARAAQAYVRYLTAPVQSPDLRAAIADMGAGRHQEAATRLRGFLRVHRGDILAYRLLGQVALHVGSPTEAERIFRRALELVPGFAPLRLELGSALFLQGKWEEALAEADALLRRDPKLVNASVMRASVLVKLGDTAGALAIYEKLVIAHPGIAKLWVDYGNALRTLRRRDEAVAAFRRAITLAPEFGEAWWNLCNMKTGELKDADIARMREILASGAMKPVDRFHMHFALARALEERQDFAEAFDQYRKANAGRLTVMTELSGPSATERIRRTIAIATPDFFRERAEAGDPSRAPIFVLGMPRSGSTLLEQILASHPMIEGTQELPDLVLIARTLDQSGPAGRFDAYPEILGDLPRERLRALGAEYLASTRSKRGTDLPFFLDKQPANWMHAGLIHLILPNAKIIDTRRDPLANCLSMFRQHFARGATFSYSIEQLAAEYRAYRALMEHFHALLPGRIKEVRLERLVDDLEGTVREVLDYIGLPFAPECLRFHESDRAVFTPSSEQVRRPINRDGDALLEGFAPYVGELRAALGDLAG